MWLRRLVGHTTSAFQPVSTRNMDELTGNVTMGKGLSHFTEGVSAVFTRMSHALKPGAPLAFTYHHNTLEAYYPIAVSILDAGLTCTASIPCPAEMGGSIHISGTGSSIIDTVFVCRSTGRIPRRWIVDTSAEMANLVHEDLEQLRQGNVKPTQGDMRCITYGHLIRLSIWRLRQSWQRERPTDEKITMVAECVQALGGLKGVEVHLKSDLLQAPRLQWMVAQDEEDVLSAAGISYRKTRRAERIAGFDQAPDFIVPSEFNPHVVIEAKITEDDGTARDKVTRAQHLASLSLAREVSGGAGFEVIACISGRGFGVRREDMRKLLYATRGKVFTFRTMDKLIEYSRLKEFKSE